MYRPALFSFVALITLVTGCTPATVPPPTAAPEVAVAGTATPAPARLTTLRIELDAEATVGSVPWLMTVDALREQGYTFEEVSISEPSLDIAAMAQGDLDFNSAGLQFAWSGIAEGAEIVSVLETMSNLFVITATQDIQTCGDLDGKRVGVLSLNAVSTAMLNQYIARGCPEAEPEILVVTGQSNRRAALLSGELDAALQQVADHHLIESESPGTFHVLAYFADEFPGLLVNGYVVRRAVAEEYPETVKDILRANLLQRRLLRDPRLLRDEIIARVDLEPEAAQELADLYTARNVWPVNGGFGRDSVQATLNFLQTHAGLSADLQPEDVADWSFLEAVLDEIGRQ